MAYSRTFFRKEYPNILGSTCSFLSTATIILLLYRQSVRVEGTDSITTTTVIPEHKCDCNDDKCKSLPHCRRYCEKCDDGLYKFKSTFNAACEQHLARKRRQITNIPDTTTSTTIRTTTVVDNAWFCRNCTVADCKTCIDFLETPSCETCHDGYHLNNVSHTCYRPIEPSRGLSGEATAGIVIAVLCIIGIGVVIALYVLRKFRRSSDVNSRAERIKDSPKNQRTCYRSNSHENTEIAELGEPPAPPVESNTYTDMNKYDRLDKKNQNESQVYLPIHHEEEELYLNTAAMANERNTTEELYENTQQTNQNGANMANSANRNTPKHPAMTKPQDSIDNYEPMETVRAAHESQEIYANDATVLDQNSTAEAETMYMNEDVYQNA